MSRFDLCVVPAVVAITALVTAAVFRRKHDGRRYKPYGDSDGTVGLNITLTVEGTTLTHWSAQPFRKDMRIGAAYGDPQTHSPVHRFLADGLVLQKCYDYVCGRPDGILITSPGREHFREVFHYISGVRVDEHTYVLSHIVPVDFSEQSSHRVQVADTSNIVALERLDKIGLPLVAHCHSHPGFGADATSPSGTDYRFQQRLEQGGHVALGLIFSRDGFCRFYAGHKRQFEVDIQGNDVERVAKNVYRIRPMDHKAV